MSQHMWRIPPIQFIMDNSGKYLSEVEERLKVADMGPDFEPTPLGNSMKSEPRLAAEHVEQKMTDSSCQSDVENLSVLPGPGGSMELVTSKTKDHTQSFAQHSETWNSGCADTLPLCREEELTDEKFDDKDTICVEKSSSTDGDETVATHESIKNSHRGRDSEADGSKTAKSAAEVRSDIFGLDHAQLWQQVLRAKHKSVNRSYGLSDELVVEFSAASERSKKDFARDVTARMRKRNKNGRRCRNYLLSCHYHNNIEE